ncbi:MAG: hypothetical protein R3B13_06650 [Polyangiaceae bacterium]
MRSPIIPPVALLPLLLLTACGGAQPAPTAAPAEPTPATLASADSASQSAPEPESPTATTEPAATNEPAATPPASAESSSGKSAYTIGGVSLSDVDVKGIDAALRKAGYELAGPAEPTVCGTLEIFQLGVAKKGKALGVLALHRAAKTPTHDCEPTSPKESYAVWKPAVDKPNSTSAMLYDEEADVLLGVNLLKGTGRAAKELLGAIVSKP